MMANIEAWYDSKSTLSKIGKMLELVSFPYISVRDDIPMHINRLAVLIKQPRPMETNVMNSLAIVILVSSIEFAQLPPATAATEALVEADLDREDVRSRLIEKIKSLENDNVPRK